MVWAMAELSALARLMRTRKHDGLRSRDRMFDLACLVAATSWSVKVLPMMIPINLGVITS